MLGREYFVDILCASNRYVTFRYGSEMCDVVLILLISAAAVIDVFTFDERQHFNRFGFEFPSIQHLQMSEAFRFEIPYDRIIMKHLMSSWHWFLFFAYDEIRSTKQIRRPTRHFRMKMPNFHISTNIRFIISHKCMKALGLPIFLIRYECACSSRVFAPFDDVKFARAAYIQS